MFAIRKVHGAPGAELMEPARGPMIRERVIEVACEMTGRDRERVAPFVCALRSGEHVRLDVAPEISGLVGDVGPVRVDWIGPDNNPFDTPGAVELPADEVTELRRRALRSPVSGELPGSAHVAPFGR